MLWAVIFLQVRVIGYVSTGHFVSSCFITYLGRYYIYHTTKFFLSTLTIFIFADFIYFLFSKEHIHSFPWIAGAEDDLPANSKTTSSWSLSSHYP